LKDAALILVLFRLVQLNKKTK